MNLAEFIRRRKARQLVTLVVLMVAVSGYFMGLRQTRSTVSLSRLDVTPEPHVRPAALVTPAGAVPVAPKYRDADRRRDGPNAHWHSHVGLLVQPPADAPPAQLTGEQRAAAVRERAARRAFDGAPPIVPHPIPQDSAAACLACHGAGLAVKDRFAPRISHAHFGSCTQCHVPAATGPRIQSGEAVLLAPLMANTFTGATATGPGTRAWPGAPPTVPHPTFMRSDCLSCHGPRGLFGLRTPHPDRQSCVQCHVPNAALDQHVFANHPKP